jgi:prepilin-type N-terminal cleavage/methylation domain-containing protein
MIRAHGSRAGVTLLELLIAVTLLSALSLGILLSLRVGLNAMEKTNARFLANRRVLGAQRILEQELANLMPVSALCMPPAGPPGPSIRFFQGEPDSMRFATSYSIQGAARGAPVIAELHIIPGENGVGVRLIVNEIPWTGPLASGATCMGVVFDPVFNRPVVRFRPIETGPHSFVLADRLATCHFLYREPVALDQPEQWVDRWVRLGEWPTAVRVEMTPLAADASRLPLLPVTVPIRVNRDPNYNYATW